MTPARSPAPNLEERLSAAAFSILTDGHRHSRDAQRWAVRFLRRAARGRPTEFTSRFHHQRGHARTTET